MEFKYRVDGRGRMEEDIVEDILKARNIKDVRHFLNPSKQDLISPLKLTRIDEAADLVLDAVDEKKRIFVNLILILMGFQLVRLFIDGWNSNMEKTQINSGGLLTRKNPWNDP